MNTVKIYEVTRTKTYQMSEQGTGFSLVPWGENTEYYEGYDDGGKDYILPDGYEVADDTNDQPHIYDNKGDYCELITYGGSPAIITNNPYPLKLKKVNK